MELLSSLLVSKLSCDYFRDDNYDRDGEEPG